MAITYELKERCSLGLFHRNARKPCHQKRNTAKINKKWREDILKSHVLHRVSNSSYHDICKSIGNTLETRWIM